MILNSMPFTKDINNLAEGIYCVTITDGCYTSEELCQMVAYC